MTRHLAGVNLDVRTRLDETLLRMSETEVSRAEITDGDRSVGILTYQDAILAYRERLGRGLRLGERLPATSMLLEYQVGVGSPADGKDLRALTFPGESLIVATDHDENHLFQQADAVHHAGNIVVVMCSPEHDHALRSLLVGPSSSDIIRHSPKRQIEQIRDDSRIISRNPLACSTRACSCFHSSIGMREPGFASEKKHICNRQSMLVHTAQRILP